MVCFRMGGALVWIGLVRITFARRCGLCGCNLSRGVNFALPALEFSKYSIK